MKHSPSPACPGRLLPLLGLGSLLLSLSSPGPLLGQSANTLPGGVPQVLSTFDDKLSGSHDPFFPKTTRRVAQAPVSDAAKPVVSILSQLTLKGISGNPKNRLALINNRSFATGEEGLVWVGTNQVRVKCVRITSKSVVIDVEGESEKKELSLREGL